jgi:hypothetical protein
VLHVSTHAVKIVELSSRRSVILQLVSTAGVYVCERVCVCVRARALAPLPPPPYGRRFRTVWSLGQDGMVLAWICMFCVLFLYGFVLCLYGGCMVLVHSVWFLYCFCIVLVWLLYGCCMDFVWLLYGLCMVFVWFSH